MLAVAADQIVFCLDLLEHRLCDVPVAAVVGQFEDVELKRPAAILQPGLHRIATRVPGQEDCFAPCLGNADDAGEVEDRAVHRLRGGLLVRLFREDLFQVLRPSGLQAVNLFLGGADDGDFQVAFFPRVGGACDGHLVGEHRVDRDGQRLQVAAQIAALIDAGQHHLGMPVDRIREIVIIVECVGDAGG